MPSAYQSNDLASIDARIKQLQATNGSFDQLRQLMAQRAAMTAGSSTDGMAGVANRIIQDTEGRGTATMEDPYLTAALKRLDEIQSGKDVPFTDAVKSQMLSRHGDMSAAAERSNAEDMRERAASLGIGPNDPAYRAAAAEGTQRRQAGNQAAAGDIDTQATLQNFQARNDATRGIVSTRLPQLSEANNQFNRGAEYLGRTTTDGPHLQGFTYQPMRAAPAAPTAPQYTFQPQAAAPASNVWASSHGGSVWAGSGKNNPPPVTTPIRPKTTTGSGTNPVFALKDPYGGQKPPAYDWSGWADPQKPFYLR